MGLPFPRREGESLGSDAARKERPVSATQTLRALIQASPLAIVALDRELNVTMWNSAAERMFGWREAELIGRRYPLVPEGQEEEFRRRYDMVLRGEAFSGFETRRRRKDGSLVDVSISVAPWFGGTGGVSGIVALVEDITLRKWAEAERGRMLAREQAANRAKDDFLAMLGHELRNPLGAIGSAITLLNQVCRGDDRTARSREIIARQAQHLSRLVDDLLDVSRLTTGKIALDRQPVDLRHVAERCLAALVETGRAQEHDIALTGDSTVVEGDPTRLEQILMNLVDNALKYTPAGGRIGLTLERDDDHAVVRVQDTGVGITAELLPRVFDLFVQADQALHRAQGGLGLGLTLVKRLVDLHGGTVTASSDGPDQGSEFVVRLPALASPPDVPEPAAPAAVALGSRRIVIIEDHADARESLRLLLETDGHQVEDALDGLSGMEKVLTLKPDIAFVDVGLPGLDGYAVARAVRAAPGGEAVYLVALTGYGRPEDRRRAMEAGFDLHLVKPVDEASLLAALTHAAAARRTPAADPAGPSARGGLDAPSSSAR